MRHSRSLSVAVVIGLLLTATSASWAGEVDLNNDPSSEPPAPVLDAGWAYDEIEAAYTDSLDSAYVYDLAAAARFSITDYFAAGDQYFVYDFGSLILTTSYFAGTPFTPSEPWGDAGWESPDYQSGTVLLSAGTHSLTVQGDGGAGTPAGFYTRLDSIAAVPLPPASWLGIVLCSGLALVSLRRRRRAVSAS